MTAIDRYIMRNTLGAFAAVVVSLTAFIWVTQALREIDLMTNQGQTIVVFVGMTGLLIPVLVLIIAPIALVVAVVYVLNKLNSDSEIVVLNAAGMSPWRLFRPFAMVAALVAILVGSISIYLAPKGLRELRTWAAHVRADLVTSFVQAGRFTPIEPGLTIHIRERRTNGRLAGIFIDDRRNPKERATFLAEQGEIVENNTGTFLVMETGSVHRQETGQLDPAMVLFDRYAFDLSQFNAAADGRSLSFRERFLWELLNPNPDDPRTKAQPGHLRGELHDRIIAPLYPFAFVIVAFVFLGFPATTRQSRAILLALTVLGVALLRFIGFGAIIAAVQNPAALAMIYGAIILTIGAGMVVIWRGMRVEPPGDVLHMFVTVFDRLTRRKAAA